MNKLSLVIPVYNGAKYLPRFFAMCDAVFPETVQKIFVNDGSKDSSQTLLQDYVETHNNALVLSQSNSGPGIARNTGFKAVNAEYTWFVDCDDFIELNAYSFFIAVCKYLKDSADVILINDECSENISADGSNFPSTPAVFVTKTEALLFSQVAPWTRIYKTDFLKKNNFAFPALYYAEDLAETTRLIINAQNIYKTSVSLYKYQNNPQSISRTKLDKYHTDFIIALKLLKKTAAHQSEFKNEIYYLIHRHLQFVLSHLIEINADKNITNKLKDFHTKLELHSNIYYRLEKKIAEYYINTKSWKLTAFLRKISSWIRVCKIK